MQVAGQAGHAAGLAPREYLTVDALAAVTTGTMVEVAELDVRGYRGVPACYCWRRLVRG